MHGNPRSSQRPGPHQAHERRSREVDEHARDKRTPVNKATPPVRNGSRQRQRG